MEEKAFIKSKYMMVTTKSPEFTNVKEKLDSLKIRYDHIFQSLEDERNRKEGFEQRLEDALMARKLIQKASQSTQQILEDRISSLVTMALAAVFPDPYEFKIKFVERRNKTEADLIFIKNGVEYGDTLFSAGGGPNDIASFALRCSFWALKKLVDPGIRNIMILDEPFRYVSRDLQPKAGELVRKIASKLKFQIIMTTHIQELLECADKIFDIRQDKDGISQVEEI